MRINIKGRGKAAIAVALAVAAVTGTFTAGPAQAICPPGEDCEPFYRPPRTTVTTQAPTTTVAPSTTEGTFKVTIEGFNVRRKTHDTWFNWDGKSDEVFHHTRVNVVDPNGNVLDSYDRTLFPDGRSVMGDVNGFTNRIQAGSASDKGGIETGDIINRQFVLIQDYKLTKGGNKLVFPISLNEWDNTDQDWVGPWVNLLDQNKTTLGAAAAAFSGGWATTAAALGVPIVSTLYNLAPDSGTRPIGVSQTGDNQWTYNPPVVILDFNKAAELAAANYFGLGQGVFEVNLRDSGGGEGDYALRLKVTRQA